MLKTILPLLALALLIVVFVITRPDDLYAQQSQDGPVAGEQIPPARVLPYNA